MAAYLLCDVRVKDREALMEYLKKSEHTLAPFGGKFLAQAGKTDVVEGDWNPAVIIIAQFPSMLKARDWYGSEDYSPALAVKATAMDRNMLIVDGVESKTE